MQICDFSVLLSASFWRRRDMLGTAGTAAVQSVSPVEGDRRWGLSLRGDVLQENTDVSIRTTFLGCLQVVRALNKNLSPMADSCSPVCRICSSPNVCTKWSSKLWLLYLHVRLNRLSEPLCLILSVKQAADSRDTLNVWRHIIKNKSRGKK